MKQVPKHNIPCIMASFCIPADIWSWINNLPPITQWKTNSVSVCICSSRSTLQPSLNLSITKDLHDSFVSFSVIADFNFPISLWSSKSFKLNTKAPESIDVGIVYNLFINFINDFLGYGPSKNTSFLNIPTLETISNFKDIFDITFFSLAFLVCIYEAPKDIRSGCLDTLKNHLTRSQSREASKQLMRLLGSNIEEQWMRSLNLAITNWTIELQESHHALTTTLPLFSYAISTVGLWKAQLYCPVVAMETENSSNTADKRVLFSLKYHQLECVIQFGYKVIVRDEWVDVMVNVDNIRCDVTRLVSETLMAERGAGVAEKHFPSRISLQLTPTLQTNVLSVTVSKSSDNPSREIGTEKALEAGFDPPNPYLGVKVSASETVTMSLKPWKFEQSVDGNGANLNWFLHDSKDGREVSSKKPSMLKLVQPKAWFKNRYCSAHRPFTREGGVIFAGDEYGESVLWKVDRSAIGTTMEWEIKGWIWLTYWPNKYRTIYNETRRLEFRETVHLPINLS
ncbi:PREDICTED: uncharacterized protein LOC104602506 [Nelumbo nucifera]|uniref:Uncharacterized protein LOC104602506 n=2 Tax=Nelumbo nucifera TaxID=4432 RepID=A0A1U8ANV5_NELNU|nr:PREDICTED: uncharacterized protein LOC104602506 [Nelumbo nucifera]XP_010264528.1 PREDICTED: uncharacterized protein LOC104602506 [Nelumbo nucifera]XP_010264529.1 PREDICTED: uncharacterized protein LOC104602506 [Nelumbo nucifera]DAD28132.1 TPA_asm: hypothetical protein HUJ06_029600 [Nelumbo nucifera]